MVAKDDVTSHPLSREDTVLLKRNDLWSGVCSGVRLKALPKQRRVFFFFFFFFFFFLLTVLVQ
jgi:hypothetical protein